MTDIISFPIPTKTLSGLAPADGILPVANGGFSSSMSPTLTGNWTFNPASGDAITANITNGVSGKLLNLSRTLSTAAFEDGEVPWLATMIAGQAAHPVTTAQPLFGISQYTAITTDTQGGQNPALFIESYANNSSSPGVVAQNNGLTVKTTQIGTGDTVGGYFTAIQGGGQIAGSGYNAFGLFMSVAATTPKSSVVSLETNQANDSGSDYPWATAAFGSPGLSVCMDLVAAGTNLNTAALWTRANGSQFDVGIGATAGSIKTAFLEDDSSSVTVLKITGTHTNLIDAPNFNITNIGTISTNGNLQINTAVTQAVLMGSIPSIFRSSASGLLTLSTNASNILLTPASTIVAVTGSVDSTVSYKVAGTQVVGARDTGWTAMTGTPDKASAFATSTVTLAQLAGRVMSIQAALTTHGLLGP